MLFQTKSPIVILPTSVEEQTGFTEKVPSSNQSFTACVVLTEIACGEMYFVANATVTVTAKTAGSSATVSCDTGFWINQATQTKVQNVDCSPSSGTWEPAGVICIGGWYIDFAQQPRKVTCSETSSSPSDSKCTCALLPFSVLVRIAYVCNGCVAQRQNGNLPFNFEAASRIGIRGCIRTQNLFPIQGI